MSTSERITSVEKMYQVLKNVKEQGDEWYKKAREFVRVVEDGLLKMPDEDFLTAITYWVEELLPKAPL